MKHPRIPKFIRDLYAPTAKEWLRWLRFRRRVKFLATQGFGALEDYYEKCAKSRHRTSSGVRCGLHSNSSWHVLEMFDWASFTRGYSFQGTDIYVSVETHDSDIRTIVDLNDW